MGLKTSPRIKTCSWTKSNSSYSFELNESNYRGAFLLNVVLWPAALVLAELHSLWSMTQIMREWKTCVPHLVILGTRDAGGRTRNGNASNNSRIKESSKLTEKMARKNLLSRIEKNHGKNHCNYCYYHFMAGPAIFLRL